MLQQAKNSDGLKLDANLRLVVVQTLESTHVKIKEHNTSLPAN
jgi:hypothetical protein